MPDNVPITPGAGANIAADELLGVKYPRSKMVLGADGVNDGDVHLYNPVPMRVANMSAFNDFKVVEPIEQVSANFTYEINPEKFYNFAFGTGTATTSNAKAVLSTGTTAQSVAAVVSRKTINYRPGIGSIARFTAGFDTTVTGDAYCSAGLGTEENALLFNYKNGTMNILHRSGGQRDSRVLNLTAGSNSSGTITITLDGNAIAVSVTNNSGFTSETATEIVNELNTTHAIPMLIAGYQAFAYGNKIDFLALRTGAKAGAFSVTFGTSGATGSLTQSSVGVTATDVTIPQSTWNQDKADGTGQLPNVDWSKGNVFQISYQWLGFGLISFFVEDQVTGTFVKVHDLQYAGTATVPSLENPNLPLIWVCGNGATTDDITMFASSGAAFLESGTKLINFRNKKTVFTSDTISTTETPLVAFYMPDIYKGKSNESIAEFFRVTLSASNAGQFAVYKGTDINPINLEGNVSWSSPTSDTMIISDVSATGWSGGILQNVYRCDGTLSLTAFEAEGDLFDTLPGEMILITAIADSGSVKFAGSFTWAENK
jgi:hypothetical protein